jgi:hypothetical protein
LKIILHTLVRATSRTKLLYAIKQEPEYVARPNIMKIPKAIKGRNKIRDAAICVDWEKAIEDKQYATKEEIKTVLGLKYKLSELRIWQIVTSNHSYIPSDKALEKTKRIWELKLDIKNAVKSKKDKADLLEQLRGEIEGINTLGNKGGLAIQIINYGQSSNPGGSVQQPDSSVAIRDFSKV